MDMLGNFGNDELFDIVNYYPDTNEWNYIRNHGTELWKFLNDGYIRVGYERFCGCDNKRSLLKNANLIKIAFAGDDWVAVSVYTGYLGGYKNVGITATTDNGLRATGVAAVRKIVKDDICSYREFHWAECSDAIEHLYKKYNGIMIPNEYASAILNKVVDTEGEDGYHYIREIKNENQRKVIFGFNDAQTFERVARDYKNYIEKGLEMIDSMEVNEAYEKRSFGRHDKIDHAIAVISFFVTERIENCSYELPEIGFVRLRESVKTLENILSNGSVSVDRISRVRQAIKNAKYLLRTTSRMTYHKF